MATDSKKREVPKQLQNELYDKVEPYIERIIAAYEKEGLGFSRFSLKSIGMECAAIGYYHEADKDQPQDTTVVPIEEDDLLTASINLLHKWQQWYTAEGMLLDFSIGNGLSLECSQLFDKISLLKSKKSKP